MVFKKLARRRLLYHSYSMQVHGYVSSPTSDNGVSFTLVHGYHGSFSLWHWLQQSDWFPTLEATLALDEESVRKVGDDSVGGPAVSRQLRLTRLLLRDLLIGVNYLHSHGLAHTELRVENVHVSPLDRHIKLFRCSGTSFFMWFEMEGATINKNNQMGSWFYCCSNYRGIYIRKASGLTLRQPSHRVLIGDVHLIVDKISNPKTTFEFTSDITFNVISGEDWPHDKTGTPGNLKVTSAFRLRAGRRQYIKEDSPGMSSSTSSSTTSVVKILSGRKWRKAFPYKEIPSSLPVAKLVSSDIELTMNLGEPLNTKVDDAKKVLREVRLQVPPEMFDLSKIICGTYVDSRLLVLRSVNGSALFFTRSCKS